MRDTGYAVCIAPCRLLCRCWSWMLDKDFSEYGNASEMLLDLYVEIEHLIWDAKNLSYHKHLINYLRRNQRWQVLMDLNIKMVHKDNNVIKDLKVLMSLHMIVHQL